MTRSRALLMKSSHNQQGRLQHLFGVELVWVVCSLNVKFIAPRRRYLCDNGEASNEEPGAWGVVCVCIPKTSLCQHACSLVRLCSLLMLTMHCSSLDPPPPTPLSLLPPPSPSCSLSLSISSSFIPPSWVPLCNVPGSLSNSMWAGQPIMKSEGTGVYSGLSERDSVREPCRDTPLE